MKTDDGIEITLTGKQVKLIKLIGRIIVVLLTIGILFYSYSNIKEFITLLHKN